MWAMREETFPLIAHCRMLSSMYKTVADASTFVSDDAVTTGSVVAKLVEVVASGQLEPEGRTDARSTLDAERATNRLHQSSGERQTQPVPSIPLDSASSAIEGERLRFRESALCRTPGTGIGDAHP